MILDENLDRRDVTKTRKPQYRALAADIAEYAEQYNKKISERIEELNHKLEEL